MEDGPHNAYERTHVPMQTSPQPCTNGRGTRESDRRVGKRAHLLAPRSLSCASLPPPRTPILQRVSPSASGCRSSHVKRYRAAAAAAVYGSSRGSSVALAVPKKWLKIGASRPLYTRSYVVFATSRGRKTAHRSWERHPSRRCRVQLERRLDPSRRLDPDTCRSERYQGKGFEPCVARCDAIADNPAIVPRHSRTLCLSVPPFPSIHRALLHDIGMELLTGTSTHDPPHPTPSVGRGPEGTGGAGQSNACA